MGENDFFGVSCCYIVIRHLLLKNVCRQNV